VRLRAVGEKTHRPPDAAGIFRSLRFIGCMAILPAGLGADRSGGGLHFGTEHPRCGHADMRRVGAGWIAVALVHLRSLRRHGKRWPVHYAVLAAILRRLIPQMAASGIRLPQYFVFPLAPYPSLSAS